MHSVLPLKLGVTERKEREGRKEKKRGKEKEGRKEKRKERRKENKKRK
jgi:hypothetical protein